MTNNKNNQSGPALLGYYDANTMITYSRHIIGLSPQHPELLNLIDMIANPTLCPPAGRLSGRKYSVVCCANKMVDRSTDCVSVESSSTSTHTQALLLYVRISFVPRRVLYKYTAVITYRVQ